MGEETHVCLEALRSIFSQKGGQRELLAVPWPLGWYLIP